jgi:hypothetical protein
VSRGWRRRAAVGLVALAAPITLGAGCGDDPQPVAAPERQVLLVSGRDDHGLVAEPMVGLVEEPDAGTPAAWVPDGTLVTVVEVSGEWAHVRSLEGDPADGWVNDFYLRGTAHLACTNEPVELLAVSGDRVQVEPTAGGDPRWVDRDTVSELPGPPC